MVPSREGEEGFGVIEVVIVSVVISILAGVGYLLLIASGVELSHRLLKWQFNKLKLNVSQITFMELMNLQQLIRVNIKSHRVEVIVALLEPLVLFQLIQQNIQLTFITLMRVN